MAEDKHFVIISGNIGAGKSTLCQRLADKMSWRPYFEEVTNNPYLEDFYADMDRWSFPLQIFFLTQRYKTHRKIQNSEHSAIQDRSIYEDAMIFARALYDQGKISQRDYKNYLDLYEEIISELAPPTLRICLKGSVDTLLKRIKTRSRSYEADIDVEYLARLNHYYNEFFKDSSIGKTLIVNIDELDFFENDEHYNELIKRIHNSMDQQDLFVHFSGVL